MKTTTISAATVALLASLTVAAPTAPASVNIEIETEANTFRQAPVPFNVLFNTAKDRRLASGLGASIQGTTGLQDDSKVACQAFDAKNQPLGGPFTKKSTAKFSTNGKPVAIAAYRCSNTQQSTATARIQLEFENNGFIQEVIPIGQLFLTKDNRRLQKGIEASVVGATGADVKAVKCQAFKDEQGTDPLGGSFTNLVDATFSTDPNNPIASIAAFKCDSN